MERFLARETCCIDHGRFTVSDPLVDRGRKDVIRRDADLFQQSKAARTLARQNENRPVTQFSGSDR